MEKIGRRGRERENIKAHEEKTSTFPLQLRPSRHPLFIPVRPFFLPHLPPPLVPLSLHLPPRASSVLGTHGYHQRQCGHEAERKELQGRNNPRRSEHVIMTQKQASGVFPISTGQSDNPDLTALPENYGAYMLTAYDDSACMMIISPNSLASHPASDIPHLSLTGLHPVECRKWNLAIYSHHY